MRRAAFEPIEISGPRLCDSWVTGWGKEVMRGEGVETSDAGQEGEAKGLTPEPGQPTQMRCPSQRGPQVSPGSSFPSPGSSRDVAFWL